MEPGRDPARARRAARLRRRSASPSARSHSTCSASVGQMPVRPCTWPASLNFSSMVAAAAGCRNFPNRVPVFAKPQDGTSIRKRSNASNTRSESISPLRLACSSARSGQALRLACSSARSGQALRLACSSARSGQALRLAPSTRPIARVEGAMVCQIPRKVPRPRRLGACINLARAAVFHSGLPREPPCPRLGQSRCAIPGPPSETSHPSRPPAGASGG